MKDLHTDDSGKYQVAPMCSLVGVKKQAYYQAAKRGPSRLEVVSNEVVAFVVQIRASDPGIGAKKLWHLYQKSLGKEWQIGRQSFYKIMRRNNLMLRRRKKSVKTTDSRHSMPKYTNLVKALRIAYPNQVWVSDITYIYLHNGDEKKRFCFVTMIMDAYTHQVKGWKVGDSLATEHTLEALKMAIEAEEAKGVNLTGVIHHSDRGIQYCSKAYTDLLKSKGFEISMTQTGNPKDNPQAERLNGIFKNELFLGKRFKKIEEVVAAMEEKVKFYNQVRPHNSCALLTPDEAANCTGPLQKIWHSHRDDALDWLDEVRKGKYLLTYDKKIAA